MSKFFKYIVALVLVAACVVSCKTDDTKGGKSEPQLRAAFLEMETPAVVLNGNVVREFDKSKDQVITNDAHTLYSITNYGYTSYVTVSINGDLIEGKSLTASYRSAGIEALDSGNAKVEILRADEDCYWLWDSEALLGIIVKFF